MLKIYPPRVIARASCLAMASICGLLASESITYELEKPGQVSINIYDASGAIVRNLINGAPRSIGANVELWDGSNDDGGPVPVGIYTWKLLQTQGLKATYEGAVGTTLPSAKYSGNMIGLGNQSSATAIVVDQDAIYAVAPGAENVRSGLKMSLAGDLIWSQANAAGFTNWYDITLIDTTCYYLLNDGSLAQHPADKGYGGGVNIPSVDLTWTGDAKPDAWHAERMMNFDLAGGQSATGPQLVISYSAHDAIRWLDPQSGKTLAEAAIRSPRGMAIERDGHVVVISDHGVSRLSRDDMKPHEFITGLVDPWRLAVDATNGELFVVERGASQQIKRFSHDGKLLATFGRVGGRGYGLYDPQHFQDVMDITSDGHGGFVIVESSSPKRMARFNQKGVLIKEWYCGTTGIAPGFAIDPEDASIMYYDSQWGEMTRVKIDYEKKSYAIHSTYQIGGLGEVSENSVWSGFDIRKRNGSTYACSRGHGTWIIYKLDERAWKFKLISVISPECSRFPKSPLVERLIKEKPDQRRAYQWTDANANGLQEESEFIWYDKAYPFGNAGFCSAASGKDLSWNIGTGEYLPATSPLYVFAPTWNDAGIPIFPGPEEVPVFGRYPRDIVNVPHDMMVNGVSDGNLYEALNILPSDSEGFGGWGNVSANRLIKWGKEGQVIWELKPPHSARSIYDVRGGHLRPGEVGKFRTTISSVKDCVVVCGKEGAWNGNFPGTAYCWNSEGLWVGNLLENPDLTKSPLASYQLSSEPWWIAVSEKNPDCVRLYGNWENEIRMWDIQGWGGWIKKSGTLRREKSDPASGLRETVFRDLGLATLVSTRLASTITDMPHGETAGGRRWTGRIAIAQGIDFGAGMWIRHQKYGQFSQKNATTGKFLLPAETTLASLTLRNPNGGTFTIHDGINPDISGTCTADKFVVVETKWKKRAAAITISFAQANGSVTAITYNGNDDLDGRYAFGLEPNPYELPLSGKRGQQQVRFRISGSEACRLWIGNQLILNRGIASGKPNVSSMVWMNVDEPIDFRLDLSGRATGPVKCEWSSAGMSWTEVPTASFTPVLLDPFLESNDLMKVPGSINCVSFEDEEGFGYHSNKELNEDSNHNPGLNFRPGTGIFINGSWWAEPYRFTGMVVGGKGEWLKYSVFAAEDSEYVCSFKIRNPVNDGADRQNHYGGGTFHLEMDGSDVTGPIVVPDFNVNAPATLECERGFRLTTGKHVMKLCCDGNGATPWHPYTAYFDKITVHIKGK